MKPTIYEGKEKYIFISYAHKDTDIILPILLRLEQEGYRLWYDDGIAPGSEWPENIAQHLDKADVFIIFVSQNSMDSPNCRREINFALSRRLKFLGIVIEKTKLPLGMELQMSAQQSILRYNYRTEEEFLTKIVKSEILQECKIVNAPKSATVITGTETVETPAEPVIRASEPVVSVSENIETLPAQDSVIVPVNNTVPAPVRANNPRINRKKAASKSRKPILIIALIFAALCILAIVINPNRAKITELPAESKVGVSSLPAGTPVGFSLVQENSFTLDEELTVLHDALGYRENGLQYVYTSQGTPYEDGFVNLDSLGNGYYIVSKSEHDVSSVGLITVDGDEIIPYDAASIDKIRDMDGIDGNERYLKVTYATQKTTDPDNYVFFTTDSSYASTPKDGDTLYDGYIKIFDLKTGDFIPDLVTDVPLTNSYTICGSHIWITNKDNSASLYDDQGKEVLKISDHNELQVGNGYYILKDGVAYDAYDEFQNLLFSSGNTLRPIESTGGYMIKEEGSYEYALDREGNTVGPDCFTDISREAYGMLLGTTGRDKKSIYRITGELLYEGNGYFAMPDNSAVFTIRNRKQNKVDVIGYNGVMVSGYESSSYADELIIQTQISVYILNEYGYNVSLREASINYLCNGLVAIKSDSTGKIGVLDLYTGNKLIDYTYSDIKYVNGYLFARSRDEWTVYKVNLLRNE